MVNLNLPKLSMPNFSGKPSRGSWTVAPRQQSIAYQNRASISSDGDKHEKIYDDGPIPLITFHSFIMGVFVSMGGFVFGYDTGRQYLMFSAMQLSKSKRI
jgi:hypothetical protein